jgi:hypothetical protein
MLTLLLALLALGPISQTSAFNTGLSHDKPVKITTMTLEGPVCTSLIWDTGVYSGDLANAANPMVEAIYSFNAMTATTFPKSANDTSHTDCTIAVDFTFPMGYQMSEAFLVADSTVTWELGMVRDTTVGVWFPTLPSFVVGDPYSYISATIHGHEQRS